MNTADEPAIEVGGLKGLIEEGEALRRLTGERASVPASAPGRRASPEDGPRRFHAGMSVAFLLTALAGFAPSYYLRGLSEKPALGPLLHVHGLVFTSWLVLLVTQTALIARHRVAWHMRLGIAGALLAAVMVPLGIMAGISTARHGVATGAEAKALAFLIFPLGQALLFGTFIGVALANRRRAALHRRLMMLATAVIITPAISRLPFVGKPVLALLLSCLFVVAGILHDWRTRGRVHPVYIWGGLVILLSGPVRGALGQTPAWQSLARFLIQ